MPSCGFFIDFNDIVKLKFYRIMDSTLKKYMAHNKIDDEERFCIRLNWSKFQHW